MLIDSRVPEAITPLGRKRKRTLHDEFYEAIGRFALTWAHLEICLDLLLLTTRINEANRHEPKRLPYQLKAKIKKLRSQIQTISGPQQVAITELLNEICTLADTRDDFIHGGIIDFYAEQGVLAVTLARLLQPSGRDRRKPRKVSAPDIIEVSDRIWELAGRLLDCAEAV
jgi:hypothetical protein